MKRHLALMKSKLSGDQRALDIGKEMLWLRKVGASCHEKGANKRQNLEANGQNKTTGLEQLEARTRSLSGGQFKVRVRVCSEAKSRAYKRSRIKISLSKKI